MSERLIYESEKSKIFVVDAEGRSLALKILNFEFPTPREIASFYNEYDILEDIKIEGVRKVVKRTKAKNRHAFFLEWFDFPHMQRSNNFLYVGTNMFRGNSFARCVIFRLPLDELREGEDLTFDRFQTTEFGSLRCAQGAREVMYFASHRSRDQLRVFRWPETVTSVTSMRNSFMVTLCTGFSSEAPSVLPIMNEPPGIRTMPEGAVKSGRRARDSETSEPRAGVGTSGWLEVNFFSDNMAAGRKVLQRNSPCSWPASVAYPGVCCLREAAGWM